MKKQIDQEEIDRNHLNELESIFDDHKTKNLIERITSRDYLQNMTYYKLKVIYNGIEELYLNVKNIFERAQVDRYISETVDIEKLRTIYKRKKLYKQFPNLDFERLKELYDNPPESLKSPAYKNHIQYDRIVSRKYIIAIIQMIFNNMDLVVAFCGREGTGKTTASTQDAYFVYYILSEIKIINYDFTLNNTMYYNLKSVIDGFNKYSQHPFRIFILDEGNELNRKDWANPLLQLFFQKLRRERKHLRIIFINLPQLGELMPSITLSRVNFVFQLHMDVDIETKLADKGNCYFFIIPRFNKIYSYLNKKVLYQDYVINELGNLLDDKKKYLQTLPKYLAIHKFQRNGVWAFSEAEYDKKSKEANESFSTMGVTLTKQEIFYLGKYMNMKKMGIKPGTNAYYTLTHLKNKKLNYAINQDNNIAAVGNLDDNAATEGDD